MTFKVRVGPSQIAIHQGETVLITRPDGQVIAPSQCGLFFRDTRVISSWQIFINGQRWELLNGGANAAHSARIVQVNPDVDGEHGPISARTLGMTIDRRIKGGLHDDISISNNGLAPVQFDIEIEIRSDFADIFEVRSKNVARRLGITSDWSSKQQTFRITYRKKDFCRGLILRVEKGVKRRRR